MQIIKSEELGSIISKIDFNLGKVEVKGDSVELLLSSRILLKKLFDMVEKEPEETRTKEE